MADFTVTNANGRFTLRLTVTETETDAIANTSTLSWSLDLIANTSYYFSTIKVGRTVTLNGSSRLNITRTNSTSLNLPAYGTLNLGSDSDFVVAHNEDGSKTINIAYTCDTAAYDYTPGYLSDTDTMVLTTLDRHSILGSIDNFRVDEGVIIPITKYVSGYVDKLAVKYNSTVIKYVNNLTNGTLVTFTSEEKNTINNLMGQNRSGDFNFVLVSYDNGVSVGSFSGWAIGENTFGIAVLDDIDIHGTLKVHNTLFKACCVTGTDYSLALSNNTMTVVPLTDISLTNTSIYSLNGNGVEVAESGLYLISAGAYVTLANTAGAAITRSVFVVKNTTEIFASVDSSYNTGSIAGRSAGIQIVELSAGDIIYLKTRTSNATGTLYPSHGSTYLTIIKI